MKHGLSLAAGVLVLESDPYQISVPDGHEDGDRWRTLGSAGVVLLFVVHTDPVEVDGEMTGRIISVRKATRHERRQYENEQ